MDGKAIAATILVKLRDDTGFSNYRNLGHLLNPRRYPHSCLVSIYWICARNVRAFKRSFCAVLLSYQFYETCTNKATYYLQGTSCLGKPNRSTHRFWHLEKLELFAFPLLVSGVSINFTWAQEVLENLPSCPSVCTKIDEAPEFKLYATSYVLFLTTFTRNSFKRQLLFGSLSSAVHEKCTLVCFRPILKPDWLWTRVHRSMSNYILSPNPSLPRSS